MKLSTAIRKGCEMSDGLSGSLLYVKPGERPCACALGAAFLAVASPWKMEEALRLAGDPATKERAWGLIDTHLSLVFGNVLEEVRVPVDKLHGGKEWVPLREAIVHWNDDLRCARGDIADYVRACGC